MFGSKHFKIEEIAAGQLFRATSGGIWEFTGEAPTKAPEPHALLVRPYDRRTIKIISLSALMNRRLFEPME